MGTLQADGAEQHEYKYSCPRSTNAGHMFNLPGTKHDLGDRQIKGDTAKAAAPSDESGLGLCSPARPEDWRFD